MHDDLVARLPARDALADLPHDPGRVRAADVVVLLAVAEHRDRLAQRRPHVVEVHARGHHAHDHLERRRLRYLHLLQLEGLGRLALALGADDPGGHRRGELAGLDVERGDLAGVDGHGRSLYPPQNQSRRLTQNSVSRITVGIDEPADAEEQELLAAVDVVDEPAEVLAEEAGDDGPDDEDRAADR